MPMTMKERVSHAREALVAYLEAKGEPGPASARDFQDTDASDLIADLLHLQRVYKLREVGKTLATARMHYEAESRSLIND
jgi:hypothetical protein